MINGNVLKLSEVSNMSSKFHPSRDDKSLGEEKFSLGPHVMVMKTMVLETSKGSTDCFYPVLNIISLFTYGET